MKHPSNKQRLATAFADVLKEWLTNDQMKAIVELNKAETDPLICHSHDFCDANQAMIDAWEKVFKREIDFQSDGDMALLNAGWIIAKENNFYINNLHPVFENIFNTFFP